jgi:hypothetical protein
MRLTWLIPVAAVAATFAAHATEAVPSANAWTPSSHAAASQYAPAKSRFDAGFNAKHDTLGEQTLRNLAGVALQATTRAEPTPPSGTLKNVTVGDIGYRRDPVTGNPVPVH